ncbi:IS3 family transposase [Actinotalea fermentans ATCC 43279 = JCM 9966 = DSM 3133]|nr:IS3 family transposase [Actinotalea fermentans ATCC 43279 = JCM 9966 = DSM 3133]
MNRFQFVADQSDTFEVKRLCQVVEVARSSFYDWVGAAGRPQARVARDAALAVRIRAAQDPKKGGDRAMSAPRVIGELNDGAPESERVNHKRVARVMRAHGLAGIRLRRRVRTMVGDPSGRQHPDLLGRDFTAEQINCRYVGDITYVPVADGTNWYLATVIDLHSRKLADWALADHMRTDLVEDALRMARAVRGSLDGAIFHSDHGSVYCSKAYADLCTRLGVTQSIPGRAGAALGAAQVDHLAAHEGQPVGLRSYRSRSASHPTVCASVMAGMATLMSRGLRRLGWRAIGGGGPRRAPPREGCQRQRDQRPGAGRGRGRAAGWGRRAVLRWRGRGARVRAGGRLRRPRGHQRGRSPRRDRPQTCLSAGRRPLTEPRVRRPRARRRPVPACGGPPHGWPSTRAGAPVSRWRTASAVLGTAACTPRRGRATGLRDWDRAAAPRLPVGSSAGRPVGGCDVGIRRRQSIGLRSVRRRAVRRRSSGARGQG